MRPSPAPTLRPDHPAARTFYWSTAAAVATIATVAAGCGDDGGGRPYPPPGREVGLILGSGEEAFETFEDGEELPLVPGFQGGHHVWLGLRVDDLPPGVFFMDLEMQPVDESVIPERSTSLRVRLLEPEDPEVPAASAELVGWPAQIRTPRCFLDREVRVRVLLVEGDGDDWCEAERRFVLTPGTSGLTAADCGG